MQATETPVYALYHFCYDVLHFRDWINESKVVDEPARSEVLLLISVKGRKGTSWAIQACADVANAAKHFDPAARRSTGGSRWPRPRFDAALHIAGDVGPAHFVIHIDGKPHSALAVADAAVAEWDHWLTSHGLAIPE